MKRTLALVLLVLVAAGCARDAPPAAQPQPLPTPSPTGGQAEGEPLALEPYLEGFAQPLLLTHDGLPGEVYVVEQGGKVWRVANGSRSLWLDVGDDIVSGGEQGLLGLAFDPESDRSYLSYTNLEEDEELQRIHANMTRETILVIEDPYSNHNGGHVVFGPDGMLWYGTGDGGAAGDPHGNGQDPGALLGSMLRLDVSGENGYASPEGNLRGEVWAKGLRNPWRFSFDGATGDLYIGDVGQNQWEEIDFVPAGTPGGLNFGWNIYEGTHRFALLGDTFREHTPPVAEYSHDEGGCSVTGGHVYRGSASPSLAGVYFFGDYCSGKIWGMRQDGGTWTVVELLDTDLSISSFGEDASGEVYVLDHGGSIHRLVGGGALPLALQG